jgi:hypothetical protein
VAQAEDGEQSKGAGACSVWSASGEGNMMASPRSNDTWGVVGALKSWLDDEALFTVTRRRGAAGGDPIRAAWARASGRP